MKQKHIAYILSFIVVVIECILYIHFFAYDLELNGNSIMTIPINSKYTEPGAVIKHLGTKVNDYDVIGKVDTSKLGEYEITYKKGIFILKRTVKVVDDESPEIILTGEEKMDSTYGKVFTEPGYKAIDNYDGDLTNKVSVERNIIINKLGEYKIIYTVTDSSNNTTVKERIVNVVDNEGPFIKLKRAESITINLNSKININDFTARDNYDGDITKKVKVEGSVNTSKVGTYKVVYTVTDSNNNTTKLETTIKVKSNESGVPVLMYHWFYDDTKGEKPGATNTHNYISKTEFTKQVKYLAENNFYFPTWKELNDYIDGKKNLPKKSVIITDDDCQNNFFDTALPVLQQYKVPVTSFCITNKNYWKKFKGQDYLDIESHMDSMHKRACSGSKGAVMCSSYDKIYKDIKTSVDKLGTNYVFAYPFGHYNDNTIKALKANGFKMAFTINNGRVKKGQNKYKLPRVRISRGTTLTQFKSLVN